ncbi:hypothetical protein [uncultured Helicobacter sp.]|uniref:hypothetical protein n=1 Tax=uncultured Helicobacter sp. TaxID=175537 RepID=UPI0025E19351|nr:hypothetical protein [uncultured Helicobacter sp.]
MKKLLFIAGFSMAVLANFGLADEQKNTQQSKNTFKVNEEEAVNMSKQDWINLRSRMNENKESHFQAALQLDDAEERKFHREAAKNLDELKKKIDHRRWIEKEGGWGIPLEVDIPIANLMSFGDVKQSILQMGMRIGVSKRQFHPNLEFRALTGVGWSYLFNGNDGTSAAYFPFAFEIGWANDYKRNPRFLAGIAYEYASTYSKTEIYLGIAPFKDDAFMLRLGYGLQGGMKIDIPAIANGQITTEKAFIKADDILTFGVMYAY